MIFNFKRTRDAKTLGGHEADYFAKSDHEHEVAEITDFPEAMPASDVPDWAKAENKPAYTADEVGALPLAGGTAGELKVQAGKSYPLVIDNTNASSGMVMVDFQINGATMGKLGFQGKSCLRFLDASNNLREILHSGNSAKVIINETAPSDTSTLWVY